jgi:hypothetical protein
VSAYPDSPPPAATTDNARPSRNTRRRTATSPSGASDSVSGTSEGEDGVEGGSMMTEPLNDGFDATGEEGGSVRLAGGAGGDARWTRRRRRNTGTRMNPLEGSSYVADEE